MKLTCLVDNCVQLSGHLWGEHGLAFLIQTPTDSVLWDTGASGTVLLHNMAACEIDPADLGAIAISHGHRDHTGGLEQLMARVRPQLPLYAHPEVFRDRFSRSESALRPIGIPLAREVVARRLDLRLSPESAEVTTGVWTSGEISARPEAEGRSPRHLVKENEGLAPDPYRDDMALVLEMPAGLVLVCGCCHSGLLNTIHCVVQRFNRDIVAIAGGIHLASADRAQLVRVGQALLEMGSLRRLWLNHCSGDKAVDHLRRLMGAEIVQPLPAGSIIDFEQVL